jgi:putative PIN family toxin of toxin-antitoxin system
MRVVVDCNVLVSAAMSPSTCREALSEITRFHTLLYCRETLQEFLEVARYPRIRPYFPRVKKIVRVMLRIGVEVTPSAQPIDLPDPDDAVYLQTALAGQADVLITGNRRHFPFADYRGIRILSPREFLMLTQEQGDKG